MSRACGRCLVDFPGVDGRLLAWCKRDQFFVCGRCVRECRRLHGTTGKSMGFPAIVPAVLVLLLFACFAPSVVPLAYEYTTLNTWSAMTVTHITSAQVGETIKISGTISSASSYGYPVALSGQEVTGKGCTWNWDEAAQFTVSDGYGLIRVSVNRYWEIADGPHPNPYRVCNIPESEYYVGDPVVIMGTVEPNPSGGVYLQALIVSPDSAHPLPNFLGWAIVTPVLVLSVGLWIRIAVVGRQRLALHRKTLEGKPHQPLPSSSETKDPGLPWQKTYAGSALLDRARYVLLFAAVPWALPAIYVWLLSPHSQNEFSIAALTGTMGGFLSVTVLFMALVARVKPSAMAVTEDGIHFWYERPADRYELDALVPWTDVTDVKMTAVGRSQALVLITSTGQKAFPGLPAAVSAAILAGWKNHGSSTSATGFP